MSHLLVLCFNIECLLMFQIFECIAYILDCLVKCLLFRNEFDVGTFPFNKYNVETLTLLQRTPQGDTKSVRVFSRGKTEP